MKKSTASNTFHKGLNMDLNPMVVPNGIITDALNATIITMNGNENVLQNDMGNGRVETAFLPEGYVPLGTTQLGGIIYVVAYNPFTKKCQVGSFPSPERNYTGDEIVSYGEGSEIVFNNSDFQDSDEDTKKKYIVPDYPETQLIVTNNLQKKRLSDDIILHPGDKFLICGEDTDGGLQENKDKLTYWGATDNTYQEYKQFLNIQFATIDNNGRTIYLEGCNKYPMTNFTGRTLLKPGKVTSTSGTDLDEYREKVSATYNIFNSRFAGNLYVIGQLETIDSVESVTWEAKSVLKTEDSKGINIGSGNYKNTYNIEFTVNTISSRDNYLKGVVIRNIFGDDNIVPSYIENSNEDIVKGSLFYNIYEKGDEKNNSHKVTVECVPTMPFGRLDYLKQSLYIDFDLLNTDNVYNQIWQYYKNPSGMYVRFDLTNGYIDKNITEVKLKFTKPKVFSAPLPVVNKEESTSTVSSSVVSSSAIDTILIQNDSYTFEMPLQKVYQGLYSIEIPFNEFFCENDLYKVGIITTVTDKEPVEETGKKEVKSEEKLVNTHYIYTNGVYNDTFAEKSNKGKSIIKIGDSVYEENYDDFDTVFLPLEPSLQFKNTSIPLQSSNDLEKDSLLMYANTSSNPFIKGYTKYVGKASIDSTPYITINNSYDNTFSMNKNAAGVTMTENGKPAVSCTLVNSDSVNVCPEYTSEGIWKDLVQSDQQLIKDININERVNIAYENGKLNYDIELYSPIVADTINRNASVQDYYAPVISTINDFSKYGITLDINRTLKPSSKPAKVANITDGNIDTPPGLDTPGLTPDEGQLDNTTQWKPDEIDGGGGGSSTEIGESQVDFATISLIRRGPAVGMSAGGKDRTGTGGLMYAAGQLSLDSASEPSSGKSPMVTNGEVDSEFGEEGPGKYGIANFPNDDVTSVIIKSHKNNTMIPVFLASAGPSRLKYKGGLYYFIGRGRNAQDDLIKAFNAQELNAWFVTSILFIRLKDSDDFIPLNVGFRYTSPGGVTMQNASSSDKITYAGFSPSIKGLHEYVSLFTQLYTKRPFEGTVPVTTVNKFSYIDREVTSKYILDCETKIENSDILFNNKKFSEITNDRSKHCFQIHPQYQQEKNEIKTTFSFNIANKYVDEFIEYKTAEIIPQYVKDTENVKPPTDNTLKVFIKEDGKLVAAKKAELSLVDIAFDEDLNITVIKREEPPIWYNNLYIFDYDTRLDAIVAKSGTAASGTTVYFGDTSENGDNARYKNPTHLSSYSLWEDATIDKVFSKSVQIIK